MRFSFRNSAVFALLSAAVPSAFLLLSPVTASAQRISRISGATLAHLCTDKAQIRICDAYLSGVADSEVWAGKYDAAVAHQTHSGAFCIPADQKLDQIRGVVAAWLNAHSESGKMPAGRAIYLALHGSYACKNSPEAPRPAGS